MVVGISLELGLLGGDCVEFFVVFLCGGVFWIFSGFCVMIGGGVLGGVLVLLVGFFFWVVLGGIVCFFWLCFCGGGVGCDFVVLGSYVGG